MTVVNLLGFVMYVVSLFRSSFEDFPGGRCIERLRLGAMSSVALISSEMVVLSDLGGGKELELINLRG